MAASLHDPRYRRMIAALVEARNESGLTQRDLAKRLKQPPSYVGKAESLQRRLDMIEVIDWVQALGLKPGPFLSKLTTDLGRRAKGGD